MPNDFCSACLRDYDAMTADQRAAHYTVGEYVLRTCEGRWLIADCLDACREALENAGSDLEHTDELRLDFMRGAAVALAHAFGQDDELLEDSAPLIEDLVSILDDATITSDDPAADASAVRLLHAVLGVAT